MRVVVDAGNGTAGLVAPQVLRELGCEVVELYCEPDGRFPNHHPDPVVVENMRDLAGVMRREKADIGIGYDGDSDRIGVLDEDGEMVWGDKLMIIFARDILTERRGATIIGDVKCSQALFDEVRVKGGEPIMWKTGHSLVKGKMKEAGAILAGEMSGHIFFADRYFGYDDAIYASLRLIEILSRRGRPFSVKALLSGLPATVSTPEIRVDCPDETKFSVVEAGWRTSRAPSKMLDAPDVAHGRVEPKGPRVVVVGGGKVGLTLAESLRKHKAMEVTVVEADKRIAGDVKPSFKWRHASWVEELGITCLTSSTVVKVADDGVPVRNAKGVETFVAADSVILAAGAQGAHGLFHEFEWMGDELHGAGDALIPRGLEQAILEGFRLGVRL